MQPAFTGFNMPLRGFWHLFRRGYYPAIPRSTLTDEPFKSQEIIWDLQIWNHFLHLGVSASGFDMKKGLIARACSLDIPIIQSIVKSMGITEAKLVKLVMILTLPDCFAGAKADAVDAKAIRQAAENFMVILIDLISRKESGNGCKGTMARLRKAIDRRT